MLPLLLALALAGGNVQIAHWQGQGTKQTDTFWVKQDEWEVEWSNKGDGVFAISVYTKDGEPVTLVGNVIGTRSDRAWVHAKLAATTLKSLGTLGQ